MALNKNQALLREVQRITGNSGHAFTTCPVAETAEEDVIWLHQNVLLGTWEDMDDIAAAVAKIAADPGL